MSPEQCRAARALLDWSQEHFADKARVGVSTCKDFEAGRRIPRASSMTSMRSTLERAGIEFLAPGAASETGGPGVRLRSDRRPKPSPKR